jgi:mono/diheme cytochrome c family protein
VKLALSLLMVASVLLCASLVLANGQNAAKDNKANDDKSKDNKNAEIYGELATAPEKARKRVNPLENDPEAIAAGRLLFEDHCAECHGDKAEGGKKGPNLRAPEVQNATPGTLFWLLTNGVVRKGMPVWSKLPEPQRWQLVRYLKSLGVLEPVPAEAAIKP